jgi:hypothetical protein
VYLWIWQIINIIIIIIISRELSLDRLLSASSNGPFKGLSSRFPHFVYNSAFLASCFGSFILHVADSLICTFLVFRQLVLISALPKCLHFFCDKKGCTMLFLWKFSCWLMSIVFYLFSKRPNLASMLKNGERTVHYILLFFKISGPDLV